MSAPPSSDRFKAFVLLGSLGGMIVAALVLLWIAALRMADARAHAEAGSSSSAVVAVAPTSPAKLEVAPLPPPPATPPLPAPVVAAASSPAPSATAADSASPLPDASSATLKLFSTPNTGVLCDAVSVGRTPAVTRVAPGTHTIAFGDPSIGHKTLIVTVKAGETKMVSARFEEAAEPTYP